MMFLLALFGLVAAANAECDCSGMVGCIGGRIESKLRDFADDPTKHVTTMMKAHNDCKGQITLPDAQKAALEQCVKDAEAEMKTLLEGMDVTNIDTTITCAKNTITEDCENDDGSDGPPKLGEGIAMLKELKGEMKGMKEKLKQEFEKAFPDLKSYMDCKHQKMHATMESKMGEGKAAMLKCVTDNGCKPNPITMMKSKERVHEVCFKQHEGKMKQFGGVLKNACKCAKKALGQSESDCDFMDELAEEFRPKRSIALDDEY